MPAENASFRKGKTMFIIAFFSTDRVQNGKMGKFLRNFLFPTFWSNFGIS